MDLKSKALIIIEHIALHHESIEMGDVYMAAHVANGHCQNPHKDWSKWVDEYYDRLIKNGSYKEESPSISLDTLSKEYQKK